MDPTALKTLLDLGGPSAIAVLAMLWLRSVYQDRLQDVKGQREQEQARSDRLAAALEGNTKVLTETVETMRALRGEVESCPLRTVVQEGGQVKVLRPRTANAR